MRCALVGEHPDGLSMARALVASGHEIAKVTSVRPAFVEHVQATGISAIRVGDFEEVLADPGIEAVIVGSRLGDRPAHLRRALQSERHVLCVYPPDLAPDIAYEAALIQADTGKVLLPLLTEALHPALARLRDLLLEWRKTAEGCRLIELDWWDSDTIALEIDVRHKICLPSWHLLRFLGGEIAEVSAFAASEEVTGTDVLLLNGSFEKGGLFRTSLVPGQSEPRVRLVMMGGCRRLELVFPAGLHGRAYLSAEHQPGALQEESWEPWCPWPAVVRAFENATGEPAGNGARADCALGWAEAIRGLELDDAARRSVARRRTSTLEYPDATEEVGFKGTMTLVGCALLWLSILLVMLSIWIPYMGWLILPVLIVFLVLQLLRWAIPVPRKPE